MEAGWRHRPVSLGCGEKDKNQEIKDCVIHTTRKQAICDDNTMTRRGTYRIKGQDSADSPCCWLMGQQVTRSSLAFLDSLTNGWHVSSLWSDDQKVLEV